MSLYVFMVCSMVVHMCLADWTYFPIDTNDLETAWEVSYAPIEMAEIKPGVLIDKKEYTYFKHTSSGDFRCYIPSSSDAATTSIPVDNDESTLEDVSAPELLAGLKGTCLYMSTMGWWTYEFCFEKYVRQFHMTIDKGGSGENQQEYILGYYLNDTINETFTDDDDDDIGTSQSVFSVVYSGGQFCEVVGIQRKVTVTFRCQHGGTDRLVSFIELSTCKYLAVVETSRLCSHEKFGRKPRQGPEKSILCVPVVDSEILSELQRLLHYCQELLSDKEKVIVISGTEISFDALVAELVTEIEDYDKIDFVKLADVLSEAS